MNQPDTMSRSATPAILTEIRIDRVALIALATLLLVGCYLVLRPFLSAILWGVILVFSTWPVYRRIENVVPGGPGLTAGLMVLLVASVLITPLVLLGTSFTDDVIGVLESARQLLSEGLTAPPAWVKRLPLVGAIVNDRWQAMTGSGAKFTAALMQYLVPFKGWALRGAANMGGGFLYISLSFFMAFFLYRDGSALSARLEALFARIGGRQAPGLYHLAGTTINSVVYGIIGTALTQGLLAGVGFWLAGVPGALLLGVLTCILSLAPFGPPLLWAPAAVWLFLSGATGAAVFLGFWGLLVVSAVDNFLKPYFISQGSHLPFILVFLGILGGVMAFGILGIFLGPTCLAIAYALFQLWSSRGQELKNQTG